MLYLAVVQGDSLYAVATVLSPKAPVYYLVVFPHQVEYGVRPGHSFSQVLWLGPD